MNPNLNLNTNDLIATKKKQSVDNKPKELPLPQKEKRSTTPTPLGSKKNTLPTIPKPPTKELKSTQLLKEGFASKLHHANAYP